MPAKRASSLDTLERKKAELAAQIKELKRQERKEQALIEKQRFAIIGRALAKELCENHELATQMEPIIAARVTKPSERKLLGLPPLAKEPPPAAGQ